MRNSRYRFHQNTNDELAAIGRRLTTVLTAALLNSKAKYGARITIRTQLYVYGHYCRYNGKIAK